MHAFTYISFPSDNFLNIFKIKRIICTLLLSNKKYRLPCLFKRKPAFSSLSSLAWGEFFLLCRCTSSFARANDAKIVLSRDDQCSTVESPKKAYVLLS